MPEEKFVWEAEFNDSTPTLKQYVEGVENNSKSAFEKDAEDKLDKFWVKAEDGDPNFAVEMSTGKLYYSGAWHEVEDLSSKGYAYHLKFFRRIQRSLNMSSGSVTGTKMMFFVGWEAVISGQTVKRMLKIQEDGSFEVVSAA